MSAEALRFGSALYRAHSVLQQCLDERLGDWHGLSLGDFHLLQALEDPPGLALQALAGALFQTPAATLRRVQPMEKVGWIERTGGRVQLRPAGRQLLAEARQTAEAVYARVLQPLGIGAEQMAPALQLLEQLVTAKRGVQ